MILRPWKEIKRLKRGIEAEQDNVKHLQEKDEAVRECEQENNLLKSKLRKQIDSDLLITSFKIITQILGIKESGQPLADLRARQTELMAQQQSLAPSPSGLFWGNRIGYMETTKKSC